MNKTSEIVGDEMVTVEDYDVSDEELMSLDSETSKALTELLHNVVSGSSISGHISRVPESNDTRVTLISREAIS